MLSKERLYQVIEIVLDEAKGYDTRVLVQSGIEGLTRFANSEIHQNVLEDRTTVDIVVTQGKKCSRLSTSLYDETELRAAACEAIANLSLLPEGEEQPLLVHAPANIELVEFCAELEAAFSVENRAQLVKQGLAMINADYKAFGALTYELTQIAMGNSTGIRRYVTSNDVNISVLIAHKSGGTGFARGMAGTPTGFDALSYFQKAYHKAQLNQNPIDIDPGAYTVILEPMAVGDIMQYLSYIGFSAKSAQNQASFLTGKLGEKVFGENVTIIDDCTNENTRSLPFDFEGSPRTPVVIVERGVAKGLTYDSASALKDGVKSTGHSVDMPHMGGFPLNIVMAAGEEQLADIIKNTNDGLLVTRFHYMNPVNPRQAQLTALTRDGLFMIENGQIVAAIKNMRFTESIMKAFNNIEAVSSDRERTKFFFGNYYVPALKIKDFHFTGKTSM